MCRPLRGQARSYKVLWPAVGLAFTEAQNCGRELARDSGGSANISVGCAGLFAGKPAPTRDCGRPWDWRSLKLKTVGESLLAIAAGQPIFLLDVPASSRASPLLQGIVAGRGIGVH